MRYNELSILVTLIILALGAVATVVSVKLYHKNDAPLEQLVEEIIHETTGIDVDFTPED